MTRPLIMAAATLFGLATLASAAAAQGGGVPGAWPPQGPGAGPALHRVPAGSGAGGSVGACAAACSQNLNNTAIVAGGLCNCPFGDTSYIRLYDPASDCQRAAGVDYVVDAVRFGVEAATAAGGAGTQPANLRLYAYTPGDPFVFASFRALRDEPIQIPDSFLTTMCVPICPVRVAAGELLVVELYIPPAFTTTFFAGGNFFGATAPWYVASQICGIPDPTPTTGAGFTDFILDVSFTEVVGANFCSNNPSSTGVPGRIAAFGSTSIAANDLSLAAHDLPADQMCLFLASDGNQMIDLPGLGLSNGFFCIGSPNPGGVGRYSDQMGSSGAFGCCVLAVDVNAVPIGGPAVPRVHVLVPGETWYFQCWYRDMAAGGPGVRNNFTDAVGILFTD